MKFEKSEIQFIAINKIQIKTILEKKYMDIINELLLEKDSLKTEVLKLWAKECKDLVVALENIGKVVPKKENTNQTGI
jgi:hypothetical protein